MMEYLIAFFASFALALIFTPIVRNISNKFGYVARPNKNRWHNKPTALLGGIAIFAAFFITIAYLFRHALIKNQTMLGLMLSSAAIFSIGLIDDFLHIKPHTKLIGQIAVSCILLVFGIGFNFLPISILNMFLTILWIVGITNAFNLLDNMDGLCAGISTISTAIFFIYFVSNNAVELALISLAIAGASAGFLRYNFHPAKIFMGDSGSMFLGFVIAMLAVTGTRFQMSGLVATLAVPLLILSLPIFDTTFVALRRRSNGKPISEGGKDHTSHHLVLLGLSERKTVLSLYLASVIFGAVALSFERFSLASASILALLTLIALLFFGIFLTDADGGKKNRGKKDKFNQTDKTILKTIFLYKRRFLEVLVDFILVCISYYSAYLLRFEGNISSANYKLMLDSVPWIILFRLSSFFYFGLYRGIWKYISISDIIAIFKAVSVSSVLSIITLTLFYRFQEYSRVVFVLDWLIALFLVAGVRVLIRVLHDYFTSLRETGRRVLIVGAGDAGEMLLREIRNNKSLNYKPICFIDDDLEKIGRKIHGIPILGTQQDMPSVINAKKIEEVIIAISSATKEELKPTFDACNEYHIPYKEITRIIR